LPHGAASAGPLASQIVAAKSAAKLKDLFLMEKTPCSPYYTCFWPFWRGHAG
jgi:hypothetical protein